MKTIAEIQEAIKESFSRVGQAFPLILIVVLIGLASFGLGRISALSDLREPVQVYREDGTVVSFEPIVKGYEQNSHLDTGGSMTPSSHSQGSGEVVGSKNSNKYHLPWCSGAQRISEANKITFTSVAAAEAAGYVPASNCPGI